jgi:2-oxo-4-hydroxy-4-carboxy-5-ureidoimidazoline decarboxylase
MAGVTVARETLLGCLAVPRWADDVLAGQPYGDVADLLEAGDRAARELTDTELEQALSGHPRIGERARGDHNAAASANEQSLVSTGSTDAAERLVEGNRAYEQRFDRVFLIRAAGRDADQILSELHRRLGNDEATERDETVDNLRQIALLRLAEAVE